LDKGVMDATFAGLGGRASLCTHDSFTSMSMESLYCTYKDVCMS
jgi:hypothetical protein